MAAARLIKFAVSEKGKTVIRASICTLGVCTSLCHLVPYTVLLDQYQELYQLYKNKKPVPVPENVAHLFQEVVADLESQLAKSYLVTPFMTPEFDIFNAGATYHQQGAVIGVPATFIYTSLEDVAEDKDKIMVANKPVKWWTEDGEKFQHSLVLSDKAKKFAIAHEILMSNTYSMWIKSLCPIFVLFSAVRFSELCREKLYLSLQSPKVRGGVYSIIGLFGCILWCLLHDRINVTYEMKTAERLKEMGRDYIEGGIEYYSKVLERNKALRNLLPEGPSMYTVTGNKPSLLRFPTVPLTARKQDLQDSLKTNQTIKELLTSKQTLQKPLS